MDKYLNHLKESVAVHTLKNGLVVLLKKDDALPIASVHMRVKAGSITEYEKMGYGLSHFFEHSLFLGSEGNQEPNSFFRKIENLGGCSINAFTTFNCTAYYYSILSKNLKTSFYEFDDLIFHPTFPEERVNNEMGSILSEIQMGEDDVDSVYQEHLCNFFFTGLPYKYPIIGFRERFASLSREDLVAYYRKMYTPSNCVLSIVGDIDVEETLALVSKIFGVYESKPVEKYLFFKRENPKSLKIISHKNAKNPRLSFLFDSVAFGHEDSYAMDVLSDILGGGYSSILYQSLKEEKNLVKNVNASSWTPEFGGLFEIFFELEEKSYQDLSKKAEKLKKLVFSFIEDIVNGKIEDRAFEMIKNSILHAQISKEFFTESQASSLASSFINTGDVDYPKRYLQKIMEISKDDLSRAAKNYLTKDRLKVLTLCPPSFEVEKDESLDLSEIEKIKVEKSLKDEDVDREISTVFRAKKSHSEENLNVMILDNGLKLLHRYIPKLPKINNLALFYGGGAHEKESQKGLFHLLSRLFLSSNEIHTKKQLLTDLETYAIDFKPTSGYTGFGLSLNYVKDKLKYAAPLLESILKSKKITVKDFEVEKEDAIFERNKKYSEEGWEICNRYFDEIFYQGAAYSFPLEGTEETLRGLRHKTLEQARSTFLNANNGVFCVYGDIRENEVLKEYEYLNALPQGGKQERVQINKRSSLEKNLHVIEHDGFNQCYIQCGFNAPTFFEENESIAMTVLNGYLSSLGGPLFQLRSRPSENGGTEGGRAYQIGSFYQKNYHIGLFCFYVAFRKESRDDYQSIVDDFFKILHETKGISEEQVENTKQLIAISSIKSFESAHARMQSDASSALIDETPRELSVSLKKLEKVKKNDVLHVLEKYLRRELSLSIVLYPKGKLI